MTHNVGPKEVIRHSARTVSEESRSRLHIASGAALTGLGWPPNLEGSPVGKAGGATDIGLAGINAPSVVGIVQSGF